MIYDHAVKMNGEYYLAGVEVPDENEKLLEHHLIDEDIIFETEPVKRGRPKKN